MAATPQHDCHGDHGGQEDKHQQHPATAVSVEASTEAGPIGGKGDTRRRDGRDCADCCADRNALCHTHVGSLSGRFGW
jgi:hypothetical protein